jgi:hypothetical protein
MTMIVKPYLEISEAIKCNTAAAMLKPIPNNKPNRKSFIAFRNEYGFGSIVIAFMN